MAYLKKSFNNSVFSQKQRLAFFIEAQQSALVETKLHKNLQIERLSMELSELETKYHQVMAGEDQDDEVEKFLAHPLDFRTVREATKYMDSVRQVVKSNYY